MISITAKAFGRLSTPISRSPLSVVRPFSSSTIANGTFGFIGLGQMGYSMARNLRRQISVDDTLIVYDVNHATMKKFSKEAFSEASLEKAARKRSNKPIREGGKLKEARTPEELVQEAETIITMLPGPQEIKGLFQQLSAKTSGVDGSESDPRKLFIDCSTIDVTTSIEVGYMARFSNLKAEFVDAPVSGGVVGAIRGTLTFMLGAQDHLLDRVCETLCYMGAKVLHCGLPGSGLAAKLTNNYLLSISNIATAEAMNLGVKMGLDPRTLKDVINVSSGRCWSSEVNNPIDNLETDFVGGFNIKLMLKDLRLAMAAAEKCQVDLPMAEMAKQIYEDASERDDCKNRDFSVVYRYLGGHLQEKR